MAIPQAPESRRPDRHPEAARVARDRVLCAMVARRHPAGRGGARGADRAVAREARRPFPMLARAPRRPAARAPTPLAERLVDDDRRRAAGGAGAAGARMRSRPGRHRLQVAIMVADHRTGEILASVGSAAYEADRRQGFVDMTRATRSPGSTLKPLIYGLAFDRGLAHPETLIADRPVDFDGYRPQNFDGAFRGEMRVRRGAAMVAEHARGQRRRRAGRAAPDGRAAPRRRRAATAAGRAAGPRRALGGLGLTLEDLMEALCRARRWRRGGDAVGACPARRRRRGRGCWRTRRPGRSPTSCGRRRGRRACAPRGSPGRPGTSYGHRDAWAIGFDGRHVVGVWMGRADGTPVPGAFGGELAAPVLFRAFERLGRGSSRCRRRRAATLIVGTAALPPPLRRFGREAVAEPDGADDRLSARRRGGRGRRAWPARQRRDRALHLARRRPPGGPDAPARDLDRRRSARGFSALSVIDAEGRSARAEVELR